MQQPEIDSAVFCDGAHYTIISRENSSILTCPVTSGAGGYTLNRVEGRDIDRGIDRAGRGRRARAGALGAALPVREHAFTRRVRVPIIRAIPASPAPSARRTA